MDKEKVTCPHCKNPDCDIEDTFCFNCGKPLWNRCTDGNCPMTDENQSLAPNMVYCPICGSLSTFAEDGYITTQDFS